MALDGILLARARDRLQDEKQENLAERQRRISLVYRQIPEIEQIDRDLHSHMAELVRLTLSKPADLKAKIALLQDNGSKLVVLEQIGKPV